MRVLGMAATVVAALLLTGCGQDAAVPDPSPTQVGEVEAPATPAPTLSDDEALRIAVETYEEYMAINAQVLQQGHDESGALAAITTGPARDHISTTIERAQREKWTVTGDIRVTSASLVSLEPAEASQQWLVSDMCVDRSESVLLHEDGSPVLDMDAPTMLQLRVTLSLSDNVPQIYNVGDQPAEIECDT